MVWQGPKGIALHTILQQYRPTSGEVAPYLARQYPLLATRKSPRRVKGLFCTSAYAFFFKLLCTHLCASYCPPSGRKTHQTTRESAKLCAARRDFQSAPNIHQQCNLSCTPEIKQKSLDTGCGGAHSTGTCLPPSIWQLRLCSALQA